MLGSEDLAALAKKLREETELTPERAAFLDRLAAEIRSGAYTVETERLAGKLLDEIIKPQINTDEHR
jgi:anti-sigma28 factor (negative regulator of flagellin synthesis)